ncbi:glycosyltransferase family 4 protein [Tautonia rosea]|uniref:glycosyltransferase family 4 protein n=1 Tax=Tautonia rosea TaxID=2728037 RepID=UPI001475385B|nr:glycosyltransferase family 4 protein [Tautonia rosea]
MRVLYLTNNPNLGSTARILHNWLELGRDEGVNGMAVVPREGDLAEWMRVSGFPHQIDSMPWPDRKRPLRSAWHASRLAWWAGRQGVDLIHCNEHDVYPFGLVLRRLLRRPLVCHVRFRVSRPFCEWVFGSPARVPDALLWTSNQQKADCEEAVAGLVSEDRQQVVYLGLDLNQFGTLADGREATRASWAVHPNEIVIGTASALKPIKRLEEFIDMVAQLAHEDERVVGVIAGDAPLGEEAYREELLARMRSKNLGRRFQWLGNLEPIEPFDHAIDIFVSTSEYETFGNSVCEAMACRRPVAAYRGGSVQEVVGETGYIVETGDLAQLTEAVRELVQNPILRAAFGERARARVVEQFNPVASFARLRRIYAELVDSKQ